MAPGNPTPHVMVTLERPRMDVTHVQVPMELPGTEQLMLELAILEQTEEIMEETGQVVEDRDLILEEIDLEMEARGIKMQEIGQAVEDKGTTVEA